MPCRGIRAVTPSSKVVKQSAIAGDEGGGTLQEDVGELMAPHRRVEMG